MIDLHSHILPNLDDGATSDSCALEMLKLAISDGITHIIMTPHIHPGRYDNQKKNIDTAFNKLRSLAAANKINIKMGIAAEVRMDRSDSRLDENWNESFLPPAT